MSTYASLTPGAEFWAGFKDITPLTFGVIVYGVAFGLLASQANMSDLETGLMGAIVFAGSSQIVGVERLVSGAGAVTALIAGLTLNARILLMTASLREEFATRPLWQILLGVHLTTDENWALMHAARAKGREVGYWYLVGAGLSILIFWVLSTGLGASFAQALPDPKALGIDFAFTAAFIAMLRNMWRGRVDLLPWFVAIAVAISVALYAPIESSWALVIGGLAGAGIAGVLGDE